MFTHTQDDEPVEPVPNVVDRIIGHTSHEPRPSTSLNEPTSHGWHVSVDESSSNPAAHTQIGRAHV